MDKKTLISLLDLTSLNAEDDDAKIIQLCRDANTSQGPVAAVCIYPRFVKLARKQLAANQIKIATVCNFPDGDQDLATTLKEIASALNDGADEIDVVMPSKKYLQGDRAEVIDFISACKASCGAYTLKVILETGALVKPEIIRSASEDMIKAGADFIKTSTGKMPVGARREAAEAILHTIQHSQRRIGFKAAGGIRTIEQAQVYVKLAQQIMGEHWLCPDTFRIGASSLLKELLGEASADLSKY